MLLTAMASCSDTTPDDTAADTTASVADTTPAETEPAETNRSDVKDNLPSDLNLGGKTIGVYMRPCSSFRNLDFDGGGEESGDVVYDAVYYRTRAVEERLNVTLVPTEGPSAWKDFGAEMEQNIMAGDDV